MGAEHFRDLQRHLLGRAAEVERAGSTLRRHLHALRWEGPRGTDFRSRQAGAISEVDELQHELEKAAAHAGSVADDIDAMMRQVHLLADVFGGIGRVVWNDAGQIVSVGIGGVDRLVNASGQLIDVGGNLIDGAGNLIDQAWDNSIGRW